MKTIEKKKDNTVRNILVGAAVVGAGVVAATVLSKEENRQKIGKAIDKVGDKGKQVISDIDKRKDQIIKNIVQEFDALKSKIEKSTETGAKELNKEIVAISTVVEEIKKSNKNNVEDLISQVRTSVRNLRKDFERITKK